MVKSVIREFKWSPFEIENLFIDDRDYLGLEYWYEDVKATSKKLTEKK